MASQPEQQALESYRRDGAAVLRRAFEPFWVDALRRAVDRVIATPGPWAEDYADGAEGGRFFESSYLWRSDPDFERFAFRSPAAAIAQAFLGSTTIALFYDQIFAKEPGSTCETPWHQDLPYWAIRGRDMCSIWLALDDVPSSRGVQFVAGSHHGTVYRARHFQDDSPYDGQHAFPELRGIDAARRRIIGWDVAAGDCLVFDPRTLHASPGNPSHVRRRAVATRWIGDDVRFRPCGEFAFPKGAPTLVEGEPLPASLAPRVIPAQRG